MNSINKLDVILSSLTAFAIVAGGSLVTIIGSHLITPKKSLKINRSLISKEV